MKVGVVFPQTEFGGDPVAVRDYAQAAGATHVSLNTMRSGFDTPAAQIAAIGRFAGTVGLDVGTPS